MTGTPIPARVLKIAIVLTFIFDVLALVALVHATPIVFTVLMFVGQPLFVVALVLFLAALLADLRRKELL